MILSLILIVSILTMVRFYTTCSDYTNRTVCYVHAASPRHIKYHNYITYND